MRQVSIHELTEDVLRRSYDRGSLIRGRTYAAEDRVRVVSAAPGLLVGLATGHASQPYRVQVAWAARGASISVSDDCTCPVGLACKHAVALILTAQRSARATPAPGSPGSPGSPGHVGVTDPARLTGPERQFADWRRVFHDLRDEHAVDPDETPIAIEFAISTIKPSRYVPSPRPDVTLRPLRRGSKGAWIRTGVSWRDLESGYAYALRDIDPVHRNAARALLMSLTTNRYNTPATLPLGPAQPDVWQMLRRLVDAGVALVGERTGPTEVVLAGDPARLAVDLVDAGDGAIRVSARLEHDDPALTANASAVGLLGDPPHGLFVVNGAQLTLVPFAQRLPRAAGRLLATPLVVPPADVDELLDATFR
ncbi:MAG: SWIM zinc finger family protein [Actinobacteria bacterium]|nr:SWIM zinc finger family protein [Actinomycetota bacterium]